MTAAEQFENTRYLRELAGMLDHVDWPGGANGQAAIDDAADTIDALLARVHSLELAHTQNAARLRDAFAETARAVETIHALQARLSAPHSDEGTSKEQL